MTEKNKRSFLLILMTLSVLPLPFIVQQSVTWGINAGSWLYLSAVTGYFGLLGLLWMYILGTKSVMGLYFRDLAPVYKLHGWLGKYATLLVFVHPLAIALSYGASMLTYTWLPNFGTSFEQSVTWGRFAFWALLIVWFTSALVRGRMSYRPWKYLHYLAYVALPLSLLHIPSIGSSYKVLSFPRVYFMGVLFLAVVFSVLRLRHLFMLGRAEYEVIRHDTIAKDTQLLRLKPVGRVLTPKPGQYVYVQASLLGLGHPFSVVQFHQEDGSLTLAYKVFGAFTRDLSQAKPGQHLFVDGSYGEFTRQKWQTPKAPAVFIAGGIGVTPFIEYILRDKGENWLFHANQSRATSAFGTQFMQRLGDRFVPIFSRETGQLATHEVAGRITPELFRSRLGQTKDYQYYICGPEGFMREAETILSGLGIPKRQIHSEHFSF